MYPSLVYSKFPDMLFPIASLNYQDIFSIRFTHICISPCLCAHVSVTPCVLPRFHFPRVLRSGFVSRADKDTQDTSAACTHINSFAPSYTLSKVSLFESTSPCVLLLAAVWKAAYANGVQQGKWKSAETDLLLFQPINGKGFKFQRRCCKEDSKGC